ncbi:GntR family transcriptional regulator [Prauserella oleivorans]|uniref:GntR family transcriptional regulator n=1 Tax=Prauserella oleivorans TaxID=1478153 RepID=A0ABW5WAT4_9PSEU
MSRTERPLPEGRLDGATHFSSDHAESSSDRAYRVIKDAIIRGTLAPRITVSEAQLARRLDMSRTPVHQAVARLAGDGWVSVAPRSGVQISDVDADDLSDVYETLLALEGSAAARLASRKPGPDELDEQLVDACIQCEDALRDEDLLLWAEKDNELHNLLLRGCGNRRLWHAATTVAEQAHRARLLTAKLRPWPTSSNEDHRRIVDAILDRDADEARKALEHHRRRGMATLLPILRAMNPSRTTFIE